MKEIWKDIEGYEGLYQVSNLGRVKSLKRESKNNKNVTDRILKYKLDTYGYPTVILYKEAKAKTVKIHRLVASIFIPNTCNFIEINHKNGIKIDFRIENLEWCTRL